MSEKQKTIEDIVKEEYQPKNAPLKKEEQSGRKPLDKLFDKKKTFINKSTKKEESVNANWRFFNINGVKITLIKGEEVSKQVIELFGKAADNYFTKK